MSYYGSSADDERLGEKLAALPEWCLLFGGGIVSVSIGVVLVFLPPLLGVESPAYPDPTDTLALASLFVVTGAGLISGGFLIGFVRIGEAVYGWARRRRAEKENTTRR